MAQNCLSKRLTLHLQNSSIKNHFEEDHDIKLDRKTSIKIANNRNKLLIKETPFINCQFDYFYNTLNLFKRKYNFKDCKYDNYQCEKETDNNNKALCGRKIIFDINNISLNDKKEVILIIIQLK